MKIDSGVYMFRNIDNNKIYIGQSKYLNTRYREHKCELLKGIHHNEYLQRAVNSHGFDKFEYRVLRRCNVEDLDYWEEYYINFYHSMDRNKGYNIREAGNESEMPIEIKEKIRLANRGKNNKLTADEVEQIKLLRLSGLKCTDLAEKFNSNTATISKITRCKNWSYIREDLNEALLHISETEEDRRKETIRCLYRQGYRPNQISKKTGIAYTVIRKTLENELLIEKENEKKVVKDFFDHVPICNILSRYNITYPQYKRITKGLKPKRDKILAEEVLKKRANGEMVKDIAKDLKLNRCTITEILKRSSYANTEVSDQTAQG